MTDFRLKVFLSVAEHLSFTKAAKELFISQPAISKHIQELESDFKTTLFERKGNTISLTVSGELLVDHAKELLFKYEQIEYEMHQLNGDYVGELRIGASTTIAQYVLPPILAKFLETYPKVKLSLLSGNSREIEDALENHKIDIGLIEGTLRRSNLKYITFLKDSLVVIASVKNKKAKRIPSIILKNELYNYPLILREQGSGTLDVIEKEFANAHIKLKSLNIPLYLGSTESIKLFVQNSDCLGIVSTRAVEQELSTNLLRKVSIADLLMNREFCFVSLQGELSGLAQQFIRFAEAYK